ncbi:MAG: YHYH protein [Candidatus Hydrogenedentes bacterium]|nr:YHYH protein [Candidatus Hydrogenedentota bacterium]
MRMRAQWIAGLAIIGCMAAYAAEGNVEPHVSITVQGDYRYIQSNGIPNHPTGQFPNRGNPNTIAPQQHTYRVPARPQIAERVTPLRRMPFGVALNGVPFDPGTAEFWNRDPNSGWNYEALSGRINLGVDQHHAHVQPDGSYHYHGLPTGLIDNATRDRMTLVGYAADGFPVYAVYGHTDPKDRTSPLKELKSSYRLKTGVRPTGPGGAYDGTFVEDYEYVAGSGDLDECNGRFGVTPEYPEGTYHYFITQQFPFIPRAFKGTPDPSFFRRGPGPGMGPRRGGPGTGGFPPGPPRRLPPPPYGGYPPPPPPR